MNFEIKKAAFLEGLNIVQNAIAPKTTLQILSNLLLEAGRESLKLVATDLDISIITKVKAETKENGAITVQAKKLIDLIKELPEDDISVILKKNEMINIDSGKAHFKIKGLPKEEFPQMPEVKDKESMAIPQKLLKEMLRLVGFAMSRDETRTALNGVLTVIKKDRIELVATDGRRLAIASRELPTKAPEDKKVIIPTKTTQELSRLLRDEGDTIISFLQNQVFFDLGDTKILTTLIEGEFPNYDKVIPKEKEEKVKVGRVELLEATKRAKLFTSPDSLAIKFDIGKNKITVSKRAEYTGEASEEVPATYGGKSISIGFNPDYVIDVLKVIGDAEVKMEIDDADKPAVIRKGGEYIYVVLPMQVT